MQTWFTSDTHYGHKNIIRFCEWSRGHFKNTDEMDEVMINNWNEVVSENDAVYHLGDFAFAPQNRIREVLSRLRGRIYVLAGNHDKAISGSFGQSLVDFNYISGLIPACHEISVNGQRFILNHYAMRIWNKSHYGAMHLFGHSHGSLPGYGKSVDVGVDSKEMGEFTGRYMYPFSVDEVVAFLNQKPKETPDHHKE
jgi:calcineurin-like phosphoesterase family protein